MHVSRICSDLVKIKSENPPGTTAEVIEYIREFLNGIGIRSTIYGAGQGMDNLVAIQKDAQLMLCGHVDVVPAPGDNWSRPPFSGEIADGRVWGRGATDMKGGCAAILSACETLAEKGGDVPATLTFVCDEETGGENGTRFLLAKKVLSPCDCIIAEPTPALHPSIGQKGLCRMEIAFSGIPAHGSLYPVVGRSAIMEAVPFLEWVKILYNREYPVDASLQEIIDRSAGVLGKEFRIEGVSDALQRLTFNPGTIHGGEKSNVVAEHCTLELEIRVPWGCSIPETIAEIKAHANNAVVTPQEAYVPTITDPLSRIVTVTCEAVQRAWNKPSFPFVQWAASDARHLRGAGFRVIEYGPGEIESLHAVNERVTIVSLEKAVEIYRDVMQQYAGKPA
ncbi:M20/M25/M40 family metallo-hydrolase [Methanoregula sp.]|uniref:M20/M25/M40 family metallo-hydrolase n=1 Tax=Methanoregula sp. TaxID=2052170 RepID=UPI0026067429|nr:M20/M25/M40 family metallo-hydrolase [Methanoregula sp.]MDD5142490.1 M20/M25/M40 family metallo-hydrolase [Methanoregula sp.]